MKDNIDNVKKDSLLKNFLRNREYILYYSKVLLTSRLAGSYLGLLWLFLDPLMFMLVYTFVVKFIFVSNVENFQLYVFIGLTTWKLFSGTIMSGTTSIIRNKAIFEQVYFHKFVYPTINLFVGIYEFLIANTLIVFLMIIFKVEFTWHMIEFVPVTIVCILFTYGLTLITSHVGVYFYDLSNILDFTLRFLFYLSPIMWSIEGRNLPFEALLKANPMYIIINSLRDVLIYGKHPDYLSLLWILIASVVLITFGYKMISKKEDEYARVI